MALKWRLRKDFVVEGGTTFVKNSSLLVYDTIQGERENINVSVDDALDPPRYKVSLLIIALSLPHKLPLEFSGRQEDTAMRQSLCPWHSGCRGRNEDSS